MKAEEHPLSQSLGFCENCGCANAERELQASLLKAEQERDQLAIFLKERIKRDDERQLKIQELEETISALRKDNTNLKSELKDAGKHTDINYDFHEGRGEGNEML